MRVRLWLKSSFVDQEEKQKNTGIKLLVKRKNGPESTEFVFLEQFLFSFSSHFPKSINRCCWLSCLQLPELKGEIQISSQSRTSFESQAKVTSFGCSCFLLVSVRIFLRTRLAKSQNPQLFAQLHLHSNSLRTNKPWRAVLSIAGWKRNCLDWRFTQFGDPPADLVECQHTGWWLERVAFEKISPRSDDQIMHCSGWGWISTVASDSEFHIIWYTLKPISKLWANVITNPWNERHICYTNAEITAAVSFWNDNVSHVVWTSKKAITVVNLPIVKDEWNDRGSERKVSGQWHFSMFQSLLFLNSVDSSRYPATDMIRVCPVGCCWLKSMISWRKKKKKFSKSERWRNWITTPIVLENENKQTTRSVNRRCTSNVERQETKRNAICTRDVCF